MRATFILYVAITSAYMMVQSLPVPVSVPVMQPEKKYLDYFTGLPGIAELFWCYERRSEFSSFWSCVDDTDRHDHDTKPSAVAEIDTSEYDYDYEYSQTTMSSESSEPFELLDDSDVSDPPLDAPPIFHDNAVRFGDYTITPTREDRDPSINLLTLSGSDNDDEMQDMNDFPHKPSTNPQPHMNVLSMQDGRDSLRFTI